METAHKFHTWIIVLLIWNAGLLVLALILLYTNSQEQVSAQAIANQCAAETRAALEATTPTAE